MKVYNKRSNELVNGKAKLPTSNQLSYGEIAINYAKDNETISIKNDNNEIVSLPFSSVIKPIMAPTWFTGDNEERFFYDLNEIYDYIRYCSRNDNKPLYEKTIENELRVASLASDSTIKYLFINNIPTYSSLIDSERVNMNSKQKQLKSKKCVVRKHLPLKPNYEQDYFFNSDPIMDCFGFKTYYFHLKKNSEDIKKFNRVAIIDKGLGKNTTANISIEDTDYEWIWKLTTINGDICRVVLMTGNNERTYPCVIRNIWGTHKTMDVDNYNSCHIYLDGFDLFDYNNVDSDTTSPTIKIVQGKLQCIKESYDGYSDIHRHFTGDTSFYLGNSSQESDLKILFNHTYKTTGEIYYRYNPRSFDYSNNLNGLPVSLYKSDNGISLITSKKITKKVIFNMQILFKSSIDGSIIKKNVQGEFFNGENTNIFYWSYTDFGLELEIFRQYKVCGFNFAYDAETEATLYKASNRLNPKDMNKRRWKKLIKHYSQKGTLMFKQRIEVLRNGNGYILNKGVKKANFKFIRKFRGVRCKPAIITVYDSFNYN